MRIIRTGVLHVEGRTRSGGRNQLVLDLSRADVCEYVVDAVSKVLNSAAISYVKWDMNRHMTEVGSAQLPAERQQETQHRYMLGLYSILEELNQKFPDVLFESCSGGGGRFRSGHALLYAAGMDQ
jgi:alpha-galactosidase